MKPRTPQQVRDCFFREDWDAACVFYDCSRDCRNIGADLIRRSLPLLRDHVGFGKELRTLLAVALCQGRSDHSISDTHSGSLRSRRFNCERLSSYLMRFRVTLGQ